MIKEVKISDFTGGLNTNDSTIAIADNQLKIARNVFYEKETGEVRTINGLTQIGTDMLVNSLPVTKLLGAVIFNNLFYVMASNGTVARLLYYASSTDTWTQANAQDFDKDAKVRFAVYQSKLWFVNGKTTNSNVLHFLTTGNVLSGLTTASGLEEGINKLNLHLERFWISKGNKIFITVQYPQGIAGDWDASSVYTGSKTAGLIQLDDDTEDEILDMVTHFGQLVIFRKKSIHVVSGATILNSTIQKAFNAKGVFAPGSISRADKNIYFYSTEGVKVFSGTTVLESSTEFDSVSTLTIDRNIRPTIEALTADVRGYLMAYSFKDRYYLATSDDIYIYDEKSNGWSVFDVCGAEVFIEKDNFLYIGVGNKFYKLDDNDDFEIESEIRTKDYTFGYDTIQKVFEKIILYFRTLESESSLTFYWYIDGSSGGLLEPITLTSSAIIWDGQYSWDGEASWNNVAISFKRFIKRKMKSGITFSFGINSTGTNRFFLSSANIIFDTLKREVR